MEFRDLWDSMVRAQPALRKDKPARSEAWGLYIDDLQKNGQISAYQYDTWQEP